MLSLWQGASQESWFNFDKMTKYRKIQNPENKAVNRAGADQFYILSWDVARLNDQSVVCIYRVNVRNKINYHTTLVNIKMLGLTDEEKQFSKQVITVKKLIKLFDPREVVIDTNGLTN